MAAFTRAPAQELAHAEKDRGSPSILKPNASFIDIARGQSVVTADLVDALNQGRIAGAGLDVVDPEPLSPDHPLWHAPNIIVTPHVSAGSDLRGDSLWTLARENLRRCVAGEKMLSVVDLKRGYRRAACRCCPSSTATLQDGVVETFTVPRTNKELTCAWNVWCRAAIELSSRPAIIRC